MWRNAWKRITDQRQDTERSDTGKKICLSPVFKRATEKQADRLSDLLRLLLLPLHYKEVSPRKLSDANFRKEGRRDK